MTALTWDGSGERLYETGIDRGVLYLSDGSGVPWNGLTSFEDKSTGSTTPLYFDGLVYNYITVLSDFTASLKAYTYPDEFLEFEGVQDANNGFFVSGQMPKFFGLSYRSLIGSDLDPAFGYKIHILSNIIAVPSSKGYITNAKSIKALEFEWELSAVPSLIPGYRPSPHLIFDTTKSTPEFVAALETLLYGSDTTEPKLPSFQELLKFADSSVPT